MTSRFSFSVLFVFGALLLASPLLPGATTTKKTKTIAVPPSRLNASGGATAVYTISFGEISQESVNYLPYNYGYYVVPLAGGTGTLMLTKTVNGANTLYVFTDFGQMFVAHHGNKRKSVLYCSTSSDVATSAFYAIGDATETVTEDTGSFVGDAYYATELDGYSFSADALNDQLFAGATGIDSGVAGSTPITVIFDQADSANAAQNKLSVTATVTAIQTRLTTSGYSLATQNVPGVSTGTGTGTGTSTVATNSSIGGTGDLIVYRLKFVRMGDDDINYNHAQGGFYITTAAGNDTGTLILESKYHGSDVYEEFNNFGSMFVAKSQGDRQAVMFAGAPSTVSFTTFFAMGEANESRNVDAVSEKGTIYFAKRLKGLAVSAESGEGPPFVGGRSAFGSAGMSHLTVTYDETRSNDANKHRRDITAEVTNLTGELDSAGYATLK